MANAKEIKEKTIAIVNSALTILEKFPTLDETNTELSYNVSTNPFEFLMDLFKATSGFNYVIKVTGNFIANELPKIETNIKTEVVETIKNIVSCSVNPLLTEEILNDGVVLNIDQIDIADVLKYSPLDKKNGAFFYFGVDNIKIPDDLITCDDMDALIWFMINRSVRRYCWKPKDVRNQEEWRSNYPHNNEQTKLLKSDGIITFEYNESPSTLKKANGKQYKLQTPFNNCLHVFIGDVREKKDDTLITSESKLKTHNKNITLEGNKVENNENEIERLEQEKKELEKILSMGEIDQTEYINQYNLIQNNITAIKNEIDELKASLTSEYKEKHASEYEIGNVSNPQYYQNLKRNYYYNKTLLDFDNDYINSINLFNEKTVTARLLDSITGMLTINLALTYKQQLVKNEVKKMVNMIVETDDIVISNCFFTFSNDNYDAMSRQAELRKAGLFTIDGNETSAVKIDSEKILSSLNEINPNTDKERIQTIIEGTITELSKELTATTYELTDKIDFTREINFVNILISNLAYTIVMSIVSPKIYLLLLINLKIIGQQVNLDLEAFLNRYRQLLSDLIRIIRDALINFYVEQLYTILTPLIEEIAQKLAIEQIRYYTDLLEGIFRCMKRFKYKEQINFNIDDVNYADIFETTEEPKNNEC